MRDYKEDTAFLVRLLSYQETPKSKEILERIARTKQDQACLFKATCTAALLAMLTLFLSQVYFFQSGPPVRLRIICVLAIADLICVAAFAILFLIYCLKLNGLRNECRQIIGDAVVRRPLESTALVVSPAPAVDTALAVSTTVSIDPAQMTFPFPI